MKIIIDLENFAKVENIDDLQVISKLTNDVTKAFYSFISSLIIISEFTRLLLDKKNDKDIHKIHNLRTKIL